MADQMQATVEEVEDCLHPTYECFCSACRRREDVQNQEMLEERRTVAQIQSALKTLKDGSNVRTEVEKWDKESKDALGELVRVIAVTMKPKARRQLRKSIFGQFQKCGHFKTDVWEAVKSSS